MASMTNSLATPADAGTVGTGSAIAAPRVLILAPMYPSDVVGGHPIVLPELAAGLRAHGWQVQTAEGWQNLASHSHLTGGQRWAAALKAWQRWTPDRARRFLTRLAMPRAYYAAAAHNLRAAEEQVRATDFDVLMVHADGTPPGLCSLAEELARRKSRPLVLVSMNGLADELRAAGWGSARRVARARLAAAFTPALLRPIRPPQVSQAIFASASWRAQAVRAGLPEARALTIYFGVPLPPPLPRPAELGQRVLWVGRLSREKGLHLLLRALPALRRRLPGITVTAIAAQGPASYHQFIEDLIRDLGLGSIVTLRPPVSRAALAEAYASHDVLFFHSIFDEPVALVLMEAYASGLPVASSAASGAPLVQDGETCLTYDPLQSETVFQALHALLTDERVRERLAANAQRLIHAEFSLEAMGRSYDAVLRGCLKVGPA